MLDLKRSHFSLQLQRSATAGTTPGLTEGMLLQETLNADSDDVINGDAEVVRTDGTANKRIVGFAILDDEDPVTHVGHETITVPAAPGPYTVLLEHGALKALPGGGYEVAVWVAGGAAYTQVTVAPNAAEFRVTNATTGELTFNAANAEAELLVRYRYAITKQDYRKILGGERSINARSSFEYEGVVIGTGDGEVYTMEYLASEAWHTATPATALLTGPNGVVMMSGAGTAVPAHVIKAPSADDPFLGLRFGFGA